MVQDTDVAELQKVLAVHAIGPHQLSRAALPYLRRSHGRVVTCASTLGIKAVSDATAPTSRSKGPRAATSGRPVSPSGRLVDRAPLRGRNLPSAAGVRTT